MLSCWQREACQGSAPQVCQGMQTQTCLPLHYLDQPDVSSIEYTSCGSAPGQKAKQRFPHPPGAGAVYKKIWEA